jgi:transposase-like protein
MLDEENESPLGGGNKQVEMDESAFGGTTRRFKQPKKDKTTVFGMVERKGRVRAIVAEDRKADTLVPMVRKHVLPETSVFTDDFPSYDGLGVRGYSHRRINHSAGVYVLGTTHTQTIEGFWALVKNGIRGVYHQVGKHYLQTYLNEYSFRYNRRFDTQPMFLSFLQQVEKRDAVVRQTVPATESIPDPY